MSTKLRTTAGLALAAILTILSFASCQRKSAQKAKEAVWEMPGWGKIVSQVYGKEGQGKLRLTFMGDEKNVGVDIGDRSCVDVALCPSTPSGDAQPWVCVLTDDTESPILTGFISKDENGKPEVKVSAVEGFASIPIVGLCSAPHDPWSYDKENSRFMSFSHPGLYGYTSTGLTYNISCPHEGDSQAGRPTLLKIHGSIPWRRFGGMKGEVAQQKFAPYVMTFLDNPWDGLKVGLKRSPSQFSYDRMGRVVSATHHYNRDITLSYKYNGDFLLPDVVDCTVEVMGQKSENAPLYVEELSPMGKMDIVYATEVPGTAQYAVHARIDALDVYFSDNQTAMATHISYSREGLPLTLGVTGEDWSWEYGKDGLLTKEECTWFALGWKMTKTFEYTVFDSKGNWIERTVHVTLHRRADPSIGEEEYTKEDTLTETREITYWDDPE